MDVKQARRVQPGDVVAYQKAAHRVVAVSYNGLWAPYFDLDEVGMVSYVLVQQASTEAASRSA